MTTTQNNGSWKFRTLERVRQLRVKRRNEAAGRIIRDYLLIILGSVLLAISMHLFFIPHRLVAGGLSGTAQLINNFTGWPIGTVSFVLNIPLFALGWFYLGGHRFLARTVFASFAFAVILDGLQFLWPAVVITDDLTLNTLYGGVTAGVAVGLIFRARATSGGTDILARILERKFGTPLSQAYLYTDGLVVFLAGLAFGWERALYAVIALYVGGVLVEVTLNGSNVMRVATIITTEPQAVADRILADMERGVTEWNGRGMYTGTERHVLLCAVSRADTVMLKAIIHEADPHAFVIIGQAKEVYGEGFRSLKENA
ncbi:MAG TPA: YitT family protein [Promineifilum sp.]|nr:YitT family protein [Promineifilum sp.]HRO89380.1 YitT family protein [Promineifilum sp.]HRQ12732.1 YitT family protein [Promineifilum sp.]